MKVTVETLLTMKRRGEKIAALTAYDFPTAKLLDECGLPVIFVGDSLGMVVLGYPDTTHVTMADMEHHVRAAARARPNALLGADLPFRSYQTPEEAVANAKRLVAAGAEFVKAEGGREILPQVRAILAAGIPFMGHLGMLPQHVLEYGGYSRMQNGWPKPVPLPSSWNWSPRRRPGSSRRPFPFRRLASAADRIATGRFWFCT